MSSTKIDVKAIIGSSGQVQRAGSIVSDVKNDFNSTKSQVDGKILGRNNLYNRFQSIFSQLSSIENRVGRIKNTVELGANNYYKTDVYVNNLWSDVTRDIAGDFRQSTVKSSGRCLRLENDKVNQIARKYFPVFTEYVSDKVEKYIDKIGKYENGYEAVVGWYEWFQDDLYADFDSLKSLIEDIGEEMTFRKPELLPDGVSDFFDTLSKCQILIDAGKAVADWQKTGDGWQAYQDIGFSVFKAIVKEGNKWLDKKDNLKYLGVDKQIQSVLVSTIIKMPQNWVKGIKEYAENGVGTVGSVVTETVLGSLFEAGADAVSPVYIGSTALTYPLVNQICQAVGYDLSGEYERLTGKTGIKAVLSAQKELWVDTVYVGIKKEATHFIDGCYSAMSEGWNSWKSGVSILLGKG